MSNVEELEAAIRPLGSAIVAFSGGVDSSLVAALAQRALGERALAVTGVSAALATGELDGARSVAATIGIRHLIVTTDELARDEYRRNDKYRCYHCKTELYSLLVGLARREGFAHVLSGANADDLGDWRPGLTAASEHNVRHPLLEAGIGKAGVRELARELDVPTADKPASPCLASRLPYGTRVTRTALMKIDAAERSLKDLGFHDLRVRHYGDLARVQISAAELARALADPAPLVDAVRSAGYQDVELDRSPLRSGSLNDALTPGA
jgi:uncharacterized protein